MTRCQSQLDQRLLNILIFSAFYYELCLNYRHIHYPTYTLRITAQSIQLGLRYIFIYASELSFASLRAWNWDEKILGCEETSVSNVRIFLSLYLYYSIQAVISLGNRIIIIWPIMHFELYQNNRNIWCCL